MYILKKADGSYEPLMLINTDTDEITIIGVLTPELKKSLIDIGIERTNIGNHRVSVHDPRDWEFEISTNTAYKLFGIIADMNRRVDASDVILGISRYNKYKIVEGGKSYGAKCGKRNI